MDKDKGKPSSPQGGSLEVEAKAEPHGVSPPGKPTAIADTDSKMRASYFKLYKDGAETALGRPGDDRAMGCSTGRWVGCVIVGRRLSKEKHVSKIEMRGCHLLLGTVVDQITDPIALAGNCRHADRKDKILVLVGTISACVNGLALPGFSIAIGELLDDVGEADGDDFETAVLLFVYLGAASFFLSWLELTPWMITGMRQSNRVRAMYLKAVLCQDIEFFDLQPSTGGLLQGLNEDTAAFQNAINEKVGTFLHNFIAFVAGLAVGLWKGWDMALVIIAMLPLLAGSGAAVAVISSRFSQASAAAYSHSNGIALSAFNNIRTVAAFGGEEKALSTYNQSLEKPTKVGKLEGLVRGLNVGTVYLFVFSTYALALWYGSKRVREGDYSGGQVATVLFAVIIGGFSLGQAAPNLSYFLEGMAAGGRIFDIIERKPQIDVRQTGGKELQDVKGELRFEGLHFVYPARPEAPIFTGFDLLIKPGQSTALVGSSGSGKSTVVQLIERFYDPRAGRVLLDGHDLRTLSIVWLRSQIGLVSQEPTLFASTLFYNIAIAKPGASRGDVEAAAKAANAHKFISKLPLGYETLAGEGGVQLSGGQKQRIAIARAILKSPKILLLDEATSALDAKSEKVVQAAIDGIMSGSRTTVIIAHRLSTVQKADCIAVLSAGKLVEQGTHDQLVALNGEYNTLLRLQREAAEKEGIVGTVVEDLEVEDMDDDVPVSGKGLDVTNADGKTGAAAGHDGDAATEGKGKATSIGFNRLLAYNRSEWPWMGVGVFASVIAGSMMPAFGVLIPKILANLYRQDLGKMRENARAYALALAGLAVVMLIACTVQQYTLGRAAVELTRRLRIALMRAILYMEIGWFDQEDNASGALAARLSNDASVIRGAMGDRLSMIMQNGMAAGAGVILSFVYSWKVALVLTATLPLLAFAGVLHAKFMMGFDSKGGTLFAKANQTASEAFSSIRTVASYTMQDSLVVLYNRTLEEPAKKCVSASIRSGVAFGISNMTLFFIYALGLWFGSREVDRGNLELDNMLAAFFALIFGMMGATQSAMFFPDMDKADSAAVRVFEVIDRPSRIDASKEEGEQPPSLKGQLELRDVTFHYPERPEVTIFSGFNLTVPASKTVALVGESGSGKSTVIGLIQRFYDPDSGNIYLDGTDLRQLQLRWLRAHTGMVSQEPVLFATSILENIRYGRQDATDEEIMDAARAANAHSFIFDMPDKYQTNVGLQGTQLSGGQKQRVAIARAVLRDPRVLLLDEATSALDATSERLVQEALNQLMQERTTLIIAHRLSTVRGADSIAVMQSGKILEMGTHEQLLENPKGAYSQLMHAQLASS